MDAPIRLPTEWENEGEFRRRAFDLIKRSLIEYEMWHLSGEHGPCPIEITPEPYLDEEDE